MNLLSDYKEVYEEDLEPAIEEIGDPFRSRDLEVDTPTNVIGTVLKQVAENESYDLEIVDRWPHVFSREGRTQLEDNQPEEAKYSARRISQILEKTPLSSKEVESVSGYLIDDSLSLPARMRRMGEVKDILKQDPEVYYQKANDRFELAEEWKR